MEDLIDESARRLAGYQSRAGIFALNGYTVDHSDMVFTLRPDLIPPEFRAVHDGLRDTKYMAWYRQLTSGSGIRVPEEATKDLALEFMIGHETAPSPTVDDVVRAKDFVASMTDQSAMRRFDELFT
jgi:hypothetical protein